MNVWYVLIWILALFDVIFWAVLLLDFGHSDVFVIGPTRHAEYFCDGCGGLLDSEHGTCDWCDAHDAYEFTICPHCYEPQERTETQRCTACGLRPDRQTA